MWEALYSVGVVPWRPSVDASTVPCSRVDDLTSGALPVFFKVDSKNVKVCAVLSGVFGNFTGTRRRGISLGIWTGSSKKYAELGPRLGSLTRCLVF